MRQLLQQDGAIARRFVEVLVRLGELAMGAVQRLDEDGRRTRSWMPLAGLVALIAGVAIVGHASGATEVTVHQLREWVQGFSRLAPLVFIGLFVVLNTFGLPAPVLGAVGGATFGLFEGAVALW